MNTVGEAGGGSPGTHGPNSRVSITSKVIRANLAHNVEAEANIVRAVRTRSFNKQHIELFIVEYRAKFP